MSNMAHYSPFNRSYQFIHLQNSAYHRRNKSNVKPLVNTNLKRRNASNDSKQRESRSHSQTRLNRYASEDMQERKVLERSPQRGFSASFNTPHKVIHRDAITERAKSARISNENMRMVQRLIDTECLITDKTQAEGFFTQQKRYKNLRRRYQETGERPTLPLGNLKLLNPTLASFRSTNPALRRANYDS